jgi:hypothetical protein
MRDILEVIREKESEQSRLNEELAALRVAERLMNDTPAQNTAVDGLSKLPPGREEVPARPAQRKAFP